MKSLFAVVIVAGIAVQAHAQQTQVRQIPLLPFDNGRTLKDLDSEKMAAGIRALDIPENEVGNTVVDAKKTYAEIKSVIDAKLKASPTFTIKETITDAGMLPYTVDQIDFEFESPMQLEPGHPSNVVKGRYLRPHRFSECAPIKMPTMFFVGPGIDKPYTGFSDLSAMMVTLSQKVGVMMIQLPHSGDRRLRDGDKLLVKEARGAKWDPEEINMDFFRPDMKDFKKNVVHSILDLHFALSYMRSLNTVDVNQTHMLGLSLGGVIAGFYRGVEPDMIQAGHIGLIAGGNWANLMKNYLEAPKNENDLIVKVTKEYLKTDSDLVGRRKTLATIDPITWTHRVQRVKLLSLRSTNDELMDDEHSYNRLYRQMGPDVDVKQVFIQSKGHSLADVGILTGLRKIFAPSLDQISRDAKPLPYGQCEESESQGERGGRN